MEVSRVGQRKESFEWLGWEQFEMPPEYATVMTDDVNLRYAKALIVCAAGDGVISERERAWLVGYLITVGQSAAVVDQIRGYSGSDSLKDLIGDDPLLVLTGRSLIYDALRTCAADGELADGERDRILEAAAELSVPADTVAELEEIVRQEEVLRKRRRKLILDDALAAAGR
jgi:uncharacterized membrane protein YebE (DUF533 family)